MPRPVVPILRSPRAASRARSSAACSGRISVALSAMRSVSGPTRQALRLHPVDLGQQRLGVDHHAVADDAELAAHQAARQQRQLVGLVADHQRVAGVVAALEAHHDIGAAGQPVDDLALALVAPLGADHGDIGHGRQSPVRRRGTSGRSPAAQHMGAARAARASATVVGAGVQRRHGGIALGAAAPAPRAGSLPSGT